MVLLDATSAYDATPGVGIDVAYRRLGAPESFIDWVRTAISGHTRTVRSAVGHTGPSNAFNLNGLPQGDGLSPCNYVVVKDIARLGTPRPVGRLPHPSVRGSWSPQSVADIAYADDQANVAESKRSVQESSQATVTTEGFLNTRAQITKCMHLS